MVSVTTPQAWGFSCEARLEPVYQPMGGVGAVAAVRSFFFSSQLFSACSPCLSFPWAIPFDAGMMRPAFEGIGSRCAGWFSSCLSSLCVDSHDDDDGQRQQDQALRNDG